MGSAWLESWISGSRFKLDGLFPRVASPEATESLVRECRRLLPITRLADLTPLDRLRLPVFAAVTPLAADLTTHLGKGTSAKTAALSATMEAVERWSAEMASQPVLRASYSSLARRSDIACVDPAAYDLPDDASYHPDKALGWIQGIELFSKLPIWIPVDLVTSPPSGELLRRVDTNGLAAGNTLLEAIVHGLCEIIERDAVSQVVFQAMFGRSDRRGLELRPVRTEDAPDCLRSPLTRLRENEIEWTLDQVVSDIAIPTFRCLLVDTKYPSISAVESRAFLGFGTAPDAELAALRAVNEAVQSRLAVVQGARDAFNWIPFVPRRPGAEALIGFSDVRSFRSLDLMDDLEFLLAALRAVGTTQAVAADLTRPNAAVPVVRVRAAGLTGFLVDRRRAGWRVLRHLV